MEMCCKKSVAYTFIFISFAIWTGICLTVLSSILSHKIDALLVLEVSSIMAVFMIIILQILPILLWMAHKNIKESRRIRVIMSLFASLLIAVFVFYIGFFLSSLIFDHLFNYPKIIYFLLLFVVYLAPYICLCWFITVYWIKSHDNKSSLPQT